MTHDITHTFFFVEVLYSRVLFVRHFVGDVVIFTISRIVCTLFYLFIYYIYVCEHCLCILTVRHILVECNHFAQERKDIFGRRDVVESFRFHPTLIVLFLKQIEFYYKF